MLCMVQYHLASISNYIGVYTPIYHAYDTNHYVFVPKVLHQSLTCLSIALFGDVTCLYDRLVPTQGINLTVCIRYNVIQKHILFFGWHFILSFDIIFKMQNLFHSTDFLIWGNALYNSPQFHLYILVGLFHMPAELAFR